MKDSTKKEIITYVVSKSLEREVAYRTLDQLKEAAGMFHPEAILHSEQRVHYTHPVFQEKVKQTGLRQSVPRRGNCWDNAPIHFKDMVDYKSCEALDESKSKVSNYIVRYNYERYQWGLKKMTPAQHRGHLLVA